MNEGKRLYAAARRRRLAIERARARAAAGRSIPCYQARAVLEALDTRLDSAAVIDYGKTLRAVREGEFVDRESLRASRSGARGAVLDLTVDELVALTRALSVFSAVALVEEGEEGEDLRVGGAPLTAEAAFALAGRLLEAGRLLGDRDGEEGMHAAFRVFQEAVRWAEEGGVS